MIYLIEYFDETALYNFENEFENKKEIKYELKRK